MSIREYYYYEDKKKNMFILIFYPFINLPIFFLKGRGRKDKIQKKKYYIYNVLKHHLCAYPSNAGEVLYESRKFCYIIGKKIYD